MQFLGEMVCPVLSDCCPAYLSVCLVCDIGVLWPNGWMDNMKHGMEISLGPGHIVLDGDLAPPQFLAHVCCGLTAGWIKMPLGMKVGLGPGHIVLDGAPAPPKKRGPQFLAHVYCGQTVAHLSYC